MSILTDSAPQFGTAEYGGKPGSDRCKTCNQALGSRYFRVNGVLACESCAERIKTQAPKDNHSALIRGMFFGLGGALIGLALYSAFGIITGLEIGYVSLAVGYIVGKAIIKGSGGIGGLRYQVLAAVLTYAAVSMSAIPIGISQFVKHRSEHKQTLTIRTNPSASQANDATAQDASAADDSEADLSPRAARPGLGSLILTLLFAGLTSPFLELQNPMSGVIGLIILMVGIRIAWKLTEEKSIDIVGPFNNTASLNPVPG